MCHWHKTLTFLCLAWKIILAQCEISAPNDEVSHCIRSNSHKKWIWIHHHISSECLSKWLYSADISVFMLLAEYTWHTLLTCFYSTYIPHLVVVGGVHPPPSLRSLQLQIYMFELTTSQPTMAQVLHDLHQHCSRIHSTFKFQILITIWGHLMQMMLKNI